MCWSKTFREATSQKLFACQFSQIQMVHLWDARLSLTIHHSGVCGIRSFGKAHTKVWVVNRVIVTVSGAVETITATRSTYISIMRTSLHSMREKHLHLLYYTSYCNACFWRNTQSWIKFRNRSKRKTLMFYRTGVTWKHPRPDQDPSTHRLSQTKRNSGSTATSIVKINQNQNL